MVIKDKTLVSFHSADARLVNGGRVFRVPNGVEKIGDNLFSDFIKEQKTLIEQYKNDERMQIYQTRLDMLDEIESIILPKSLRAIGEGAFRGLKFLTRINLPEKLESIGAKAFYGCENLEQICIPASVKTLGHAAFEKCDGLVKAFLPIGLNIDKADIFWDCSHVKFYRYTPEQTADKAYEEFVSADVVLSQDSIFYPHN